MPRLGPDRSQRSCQGFAVRPSASAREPLTARTTCYPGKSSNPARLLLRFLWGRTSPLYEVTRRTELGIFGS